MSPAAIPFRTSEDGRAAYAHIGAHVRDGGLIAYPTETVYGIGGALLPPAFDALRLLKGARAGKGYLVVVASMRMAEELKLTWTGAARELAAKHWPGPLTLVLPGGDSRLDELRGSSGGVGVRQTSHPALLTFLGELGGPITSTSANDPGAPPAQSVQDVESAFATPIRNGQVVVLDGGLLPPSAPSTVVDCTGNVPRIVRAGAIPEAELRRTTPAMTGMG